MNPSQTFTFAGNGINTGANTNVLLNNPADIVSQAKGFELQYQNLTSSGTIFEQSEIKYVGITSDFALRAIPFDPTAGTGNQSTVMVFAVAMHKDFAIPGELGTQVRISDRSQPHRRHRHRPAQLHLEHLDQPKRLLHRHQRHER